MKSPASVRSWRRSGAFWLLVVVAFAGLFAPVVANDVPLVARVRGEWCFPAFADLVGPAPGGPNDLTWKQWWSRLPADSDDFAVMPPWPYGPTATDAERFRAGPSMAHWLGCDESGRDVLARLVHGAGAVVWLVLPAVAMALAFGTLLGAWAGLRRGLVDTLVLRLIELALCFPVMLFLLFAAAFFGDSSLAFVVVLASLQWTSFARVVRGQLLSLRERDFVHVARGLGVPGWRVATRHLLPLVGSQIAMTAAFCVANAILAESTLAFLGLGPGDLPSSWGAMLRRGADQAAFGSWHLWSVPAAAIVGVVLACHALADRWRRAGAAAP